MRKAIAEARKGILSGQAPFGACIARGGAVLACAHNEVWKRRDATAHAEINAIKKACGKLGSFDLSGCEIYSTAEPCPMCFAACHWARIGRIVYGASISDARRAGFNELRVSNEALKRAGKSPVKITKNFLGREARALFREWKQAGGRPY
jgi:tRNA(Arg) A34 adenosine deaminase TadA